MGWEFSLDDDVLLKVSGVTSACYALHLFATPRHAHDTYYQSGAAGDVSHEHEVTARWFGYAVGGQSAMQLAAGCSKNSKDAKKNLLKVNGGAWLGTTAMHLYFAHDGVERKEVAYSAAALAAVLGTLCLWRGFKKDDEEDEGEKKKAA